MPGRKGLLFVIYVSLAVSYSLATQPIPVYLSAVVLPRGPLVGGERCCTALTRAGRQTLSRGELMTAES